MAAAHSLVIVESPAKTGKIQGFLGPGWKVVATMGHLRALTHSLSAVGLDRDFEPTYEWMETKKKAADQIKAAAKGATAIYLASDDDREGEGIAYAVATLLRIPEKKAMRAVFHEITETAVKHAIAHPRPLDMNKVYSQQARAMMDLLVGFTISPLLWKSIAPSLSAGRCQTPALRLVVEREDHIDAFTAEHSWAISGKWIAPTTGITFPARLVDELADEESARTYLENIHSSPHASITKKEIRPWSEGAPAPLITSSLQQQTSAMFHLNPKSTMAVAQRLYEAGKITYMRTDCPVLSEEAVAAIREWIREQLGAAYIAPPSPPKAAKKKAKAHEDVKAQEAHEAIRPVHVEESELPAEEEWSPLDQKVYRLIWQRTVQSVMSAVQGETCTLRFCIQDADTGDLDREMEWSAQWKQTTFEGWRRVGKVAVLDQEDQDDQDDQDDEKKEDRVWSSVTSLNENDRLEWTQLTAEPKETRSKGRFTEATLVRELESNGIGRPSTYASLLATIQDRGYVEIKQIPATTVRVSHYQLNALHQWPPTTVAVTKQVGAEKNKLVPTPLGRSVTEYLQTNMPDLFAYPFTAAMEKQLDRVARGEEDWKEPLRLLWASYHDRYERLLGAGGAGGAGGAAVASEKVRILSADGHLKAVQTKKGPLLLREGADAKETQFFGWPKGVRWDTITEEEAMCHVRKEHEQRAAALQPIGEHENAPIFKKEGKFGTYLQWKDVSITYQPDEPMEQTLARFQAKQTGAIVEFKEYSIRTGQYGPYIMKTTLKKPQFVSLPKGIDPLQLTAKDVDQLYRMGMETKKKKAAKK